MTSIESTVLTHLKEIFDSKSYIEWASAQSSVMKLECIREVAVRAVLRSLPFVRRFGKTPVGSNSTAVILTLKHLLWSRNSISEYVEKIPEGVDHSVASTTHRAAALLCAGDWVNATTVANYSFQATRDRGTVHQAWHQTRLDVEQFQKLDGWERIRELPLWDNFPSWWEKELRKFYELILKLPMLEQDFGIWPVWYDTIVAGQPAFQLKNQATANALERAIALGGKDGKFHKEFWDREPGEINREIAEWLAEARAAEVVGDVVAVPAELDFPAQSLDATMFALNAAGRIERIAIPPEQQLFITPLQQRQYKTLRSDAEGLLGRGQILGKLGSEISDLLEMLPADMTHAAVFDVWRAINRLRRTLNAHVRVVDIDEPHEAKLELSIAEELGFLLDTANNFAFDDPGLRRRDEQSIPPQDKQSIAEEWALGDVIAKAALNEPEIFTPAALEVVKAEERNAETAGEDAHGQQAIDQTNKTRRNVIAALLSVLKGESGFAWKEMRSGVYKKAGELGAIAVATDVLGWTTIYPAIWNFVVRHSSNLSAYVKTVYNNPTLTAYIEYISQAAGY